MKKNKQEMIAKVLTETASEFIMNNVHKGGEFMQAIVETVFDIVYLCTVITLGLIMIRQGRGHRRYVLFGIMAVTLGAGDAFHLVPRAVALCTTGWKIIRSRWGSENSSPRSR